MKPIEEANYLRSLRILISFKTKIEILIIFMLVMLVPSLAPPNLINAHHIYHEDNNPSRQHQSSSRTNVDTAAAAAELSDPLEWASSNFTTYFADRDSNTSWPTRASLNVRQVRSNKSNNNINNNNNNNNSDRDQKLNAPVSTSELPPPNSKELAFFGLGPLEDYEDDDYEDDEEDGDALSALLNGDSNSNLDEQQPLVDYEDALGDEEDFYSKNPVETIEWKLKSEPQLKRKPPTNAADASAADHKDHKAAGSVEAKTTEGDQSEAFDDFDDFDALHLKSFYGNEEARPTHKRPLAREKAPRNLTHGVIKNRHKDHASERSASESRQRGKKNRLKTRRKKKKKKKRKRKKRKGNNEMKRGQQVVITRDKEEHSKGIFSHTKAGLPREAAESQQEYYNAGTQACATFTSTGVCVTYDSVEWALSRARRMIGFRRPAGLNSLEPSEETINAVGELTEWTSRLLAVRYGLSGDDLALGLEQVDTSQTSLWRTCPRLFRSPMARRCFGTLGDDARRQNRGGVDSINRAVLLSGRYRSYTGQCNNPLVPHYGTSYMPFVRLSAPEYADALGVPRMMSLNSGGQLPPARVVSLNLHPSYEVPSNDHSAMFAAWGQLINHDLALASGARAETGHDGSCCSRLAANPRNQRLSDPLNRVCMPIVIGPGDPVYAPYGVRCHDFKRSIAGLRPGCSLGPRTQLNLVSSFVDASFVYGSTRTVGESLRSARRRGQLAMWYYFGARRQPLLPPQLDAPDAECRSRPEGLFCFRSGDSRTNQQVPLVVLHTIHTRQHNRLARTLALINPHWSSDRLYEEARHIHIAQVQHILLSEYLPELLGARTAAKFELDETLASTMAEATLADMTDHHYDHHHQEDLHWDHYDATLNPGISQEFAAAAFRQGHSSVPNRVFRLDPLTRAPRRVYELRDLFRQPWPLFEPGAVDEFLAGLVDTPAQGVDPFVSLELSGHLLEEPDEPVGLDLIAINIQRGRDQGLASYNSMREWCGLGRLANFNELARVMGNTSAQIMSSLYESVDDIDLYSGGLSELPLEVGAQLGPTFSCIIGHQFGMLRRADRFWYESSGGPHAFTSAQLASIKQVPLARLVCANSDQLNFIQPLAMRLAHPIYNPMAACNELPDLDLSLWLETPPPQVDVASGGQVAEDEGDEEAA